LNNIGYSLHTVSVDGIPPKRHCRRPGRLCRGRLRINLLKRPHRVKENSFSGHASFGLYERRFRPPAGFGSGSLEALWRDLLQPTGGVENEE